MSSIVEIDINNLKESYEFNKVAKQTDGAVLYKSGKAVLLATVAIDKEDVEEDFLPLTVQYIEKSYAAAKIPGGFVKRESKPSDFEILTSRIVDRALRPLFPKNFRKNTVITILVLSSDNNIDLQIAALHAANAAMLVSSLHIQKSIAAIRVTKINNNLVLNPTLSELKKGTLDLLLVGTNDDITMIEMRVISSKEEKFKVNELNEEELIKIIQNVSKNLNIASNLYLNRFQVYSSKKSITIEDKFINKELLDFIKLNYTNAINSALEKMAKSERADILDEILKDILKDIENSNLDVDILDIKEIFSTLIKERVRELILEGKRLDGRALDEVRPIEIETNILPSVHGSTLFTRGETQALVTATLGDKKDAQMYELLTSSSVENENFMVHYNFPPFCVGEARPIGPPSRRELGHGNLAKRAVEPTIELDDNQTVRVVSEILESNGSSSMATVCGASLSLYCINVNVKKLVAGIAMGVVVKDNSYAVLTDIVGAEDHYGDMDLKVAGTIDGITAMQMDIKIEGLDLDILKNALIQAKKGINFILNIMEEARKEIKPSLALPIIILFEVTQKDIPVIIGKGGSTIREIISKFDVSIDIDRNKGVVKITGSSFESVESAKVYIEKLLEEEESRY